MPVNVLARETFNLPPGQSFSAPNTSRELQMVRHRTLDFDIWAVVTNRERSNTFFSPCTISRSNSPHINKTNGEEGGKEEKPKTHILGPTRQQTEIYFKNKNGSFHGLPIGYEKRPLTSIDFSLLESKINDPHLQRSQERLRASVTDIATSSILSRRNRIALAAHAPNDSDIKFFAELVKPMQYKWRRDRERVLASSKHGYHPRSQSPTFKRLIEVTQKLECFAEPELELDHRSGTETPPEAEVDSGLGSLIGNVKDDVPNKSFDHLEKLDELRIEAMRAIRSEPNCSKVNGNDAVRDGGDVPHVDSVKKCTNVENEDDDEVFKPDQAKKQHRNSIERDEDDDAVSTADSNYQPLSMEDYFKVDFRVQKSHAELHLFLPHIDGRSSQIESRASNYAIHNTCKHEKPSPLKLPSISLDEQCESFSKGTPSVSSRRSRRDAKKKKKKASTSRAKSAERDKEVKDRLNDVPTLISIENEKSHVHNGICPFNPCPYHSKMQKNHTALT